MHRIEMRALGVLWNHCFESNLVWHFDLVMIIAIAKNNNVNKGLNNKLKSQINEYPVCTDWTKRGCIAPHHLSGM